MTGRIKKVYKHKISIVRVDKKEINIYRGVDIENLIQVVKWTEKVVTDLRYKEKVEDK